MAGGFVCGLVTAGAIGAVLGSLGEYRVHDSADTDAPIGSAGVTDLLSGVLVREVDGSVPADHPDDTTMSEPD